MFFHVSKSKLHRTPAGPSPPHIRFPSRFEPPRRLPPAGRLRLFEPSQRRRGRRPPLPPRRGAGSGLRPPPPQPPRRPPQTKRRRAGLPCSEALGGCRQPAVLSTTAPPAPSAGRAAAGAWAEGRKRRSLSAGGAERDGQHHPRPFLACPRLNAISRCPRRGAPPAPRPSWPPCRAQVRLVKPPPPAAEHGQARGARRSRRPQGRVIAPQRRAAAPPPPKPPLTLRSGAAGGRGGAGPGAPERGAASRGLPRHHAAPPASPIVKGPSGPACVQSQAAPARGRPPANRLLPYSTARPLGANQGAALTRHTDLRGHAREGFGPAGLP